jgi:hypothetical protein
MAVTSHFFIELKNCFNGEEMKKILLFAIYFLAFFLISSAQEVIKNSDKPKSNRAGRTLMLKEAMRIRDDGEKAIFKQPKNLFLMKDNSILFLDLIESSNLYKFSPNGQFVFKILKKGQGPEECQWASNFIMNEDRIRVWAYSPPKIIDYDLDGKFINEFKVPRVLGLYFLGSIDGKIYGLHDEIHTSEAIRQEGLIETPYRLYEISGDFQRWKMIYDFPMQHHIKKGHWSRRGMIAVTAYKHYLFVVHTAEYKIVKFDIQRSQIDKIFTRKYERQKTQDNKDEEDRSDTELRGLRPPPFKYDFDIRGLNVVNDTLWVTTSTPHSSNSRRLIDVFDMEGNYIDNFFIQFPPNNEKHFYGDFLISNDGFIFMIEQNEEDGLVSIGKYQMDEGN